MGIFPKIRNDYSLYNIYNFKNYIDNYQSRANVYINIKIH